MPLIVPLPGLLLALSGCALIASPLDLEDELDLDFSEGTGPSIDSIEPVWGLTSGGTSVVLRGAGFDPSARVTFGDVEADVLQGFEDELTVRLPEVDAAGAVDVTIQSDTGSTVLPGAFRYLTDGQGLTSVVGYLEYSEHVGDYWSSTADPTAVAALTVVDATDFAWEDTYTTAIDQCKVDSEWEGAITTLDLGLDSVTLTGGGATLDLPWSAEDGFFTAELDTADYAFATDYDLEPVEPTGLPAFDVEGIVRTPSSSFTILYPAIEGATVTYVTSTIPLSWAGGGGDYVLISIGLRNSDASAYDEWITCAVTNDGAFTVPDLWSSWPSNRQVDFFVSMARHPESVLSFTGGESGVVGLYTKVGAAFSF